MDCPPHLGHAEGAEQKEGIGLLVERAVGQWIRVNPGAMTHRLSRNPEMKNDDLVAEAFVRQIASQDREAALACSNTLRHPGLREEISNQQGAEKSPR